MEEEYRSIGEDKCQGKIKGRGMSRDNRKLNVQRRDPKKGDIADEESKGGGKQHTRKREEQKKLHRGRER